MGSNLVNQTALVTGGNRGIGKAIAVALARAGARVGITGRNASTLAETAAELEALTPGAWWKVCDARSEEEQKAVFVEARRRFGKLDIAVPNAGEATLAKVTETALPDFRRDIETNLTGVFLTIRESMIWMKETGGGTILPILSQASKVPFTMRGAYCASKWGALGLVEVARLEGKEHGIRFTALLPASVATDFQAGNPHGTDWMLQADDVADAVLYALSVSDRVELPEILMRCRKKK